MAKVIFKSYKETAMTVQRLDRKRLRQQLLLLGGGESLIMAPADFYKLPPWEQKAYVQACRETASRMTKKGIREYSVTARDYGCVISLRKEQRRTARND